MRKLDTIISSHRAAGLMLLLLLILSVYHLVAILGWIPGELAWGGRLEDAAQFRQMEIMALLTTVIMAALVAGRVGYITDLGRPTLFRWSMWLIVIFMALSFLGNLVAYSDVERFVFAPMALLLALLAFRLAI